MPQNNQLTPGSNYSNQQSLSPMSPGYGNYGRSRPQVTRSATSPVPRLAASPAPPSPDFKQTNMDCAFPPFPRNAKPSNTSKSREKVEKPSYNHQYAPASPLYAPLSPRLNGGETISTRMDNIAPGPFDGSDRRPSTSDGRNASGLRDADFGHRRTATQESFKSQGKPSNQRMSSASTMSRTSTYSNRSIGLPRGPKLGVAGALPAPPAPPRTEDQTEGIDAFLNRLRKETTQTSQRNQEPQSQTLPLRQESNNDTLEALNPDHTPDFKSFAQIAVSRPIKLFCTEPIVFMVSVMSAVAFGMIYLFTDALPPIYQSMGFSSTLSTEY